MLAMSAVPAATSLAARAQVRCVSAACHSRVADTSFFPLTLNPRARWANVTSPVRFPLLLHDPAECVFLSAAIAARGQWEAPWVERLLMRLWQTRHWTGRPELFVDVGAHIGVYSLSAAYAGFPVLALEPMPYNLELMHQSLRTAPESVRRRITLIEEALSDTASRLCIRPLQSAAQPNRGNGQLAAATTCPASETVPSRTLDTVLRTLRSRDDEPCIGVAALKIDVENHEAAVFHGASELLSGACAPCLIHVEHDHDPAALCATDAPDAICILQGYGFECSRLPGSTRDWSCVNMRLESARRCHRWQAISDETDEWRGVRVQRGGTGE